MIELKCGCKFEGKAIVACEQHILKFRMILKEDNWDMLYDEEIKELMNNV